MTLSKSQYIRALQCYKSLWLYKNKPQLRDIPDEAQQSLFNTGYQVGDLAKELFPNGIEIEFNSDNFDEMIQKTKKLIDSGCEIIYEATFKENNIFVMADILVKNGDSWDIYEVKASTSVKDYHLNDAAIQWYAISKVLKLNRIYITHINNQYVRKGKLDINQLFTKTDVTEIIKQKQTAIPDELTKIEKILNQNKEPDIKIGKHCTNPYTCDFYNYCWKDIPKENSVFDISYANGKQWELFDKGIYTIDEIPENFSFGKNASLQIKHHKSQKITIDKEKIKEFLDTIKYPINFFDFETFQDAIPRFDNQKPYQQIPFQYSLHILHKDGTLEHKEFLADENKDPRKDLIESMLNNITKTGSIIAFNKSFEITQIKNLAKFCPSKSKQLLDLIDRFIDLAYPFQYKHYYHPNFKGKYSIKIVLPTLFPNDDELDYKKLGSIQNGGDAMNTFANLHLLKDKSKRDEIRKDLLAYCKLDTLAMVRIWEKLYDLIKE